jgi:hypothetical protein
VRKLVACALFHDGPQWPGDLESQGRSDLLLRRSFRATSPSATIQVRPRVVGLSVPPNDRRGRHVLARVWHGRRSMRTTGSLVDRGHARRYATCQVRLWSPGDSPAAAQSCRPCLTLKCQRLASSSRSQGTGPRNTVAWFPGDRYRVRYPRMVETALGRPGYTNYWSSRTQFRIYRLPCWMLSDA